MKDLVESFPLALKAIFKDPVNILLSVIPTLVALSLYVLTIVAVYRGSDRYVAIFKEYVSTPDQASMLGRILTAVLIIFIFFLMSWTFVVIVGVIAAPFNSLLSSRIEKKLRHEAADPEVGKALEKVGRGLGHTFLNEFKKLIFLAIMTGLAFILNLFPLFYPLVLFLMATLLSVQFIDYSWSRHELRFRACLKDVLKNILPYSVSGFLFLLLVAIPIINAFIPAFATSYFTVLWLRRQKKPNVIPGAA